MPLAYDLKHLDARRICLIKPSALGDVVQSLPLLPALRERFPRAHISWVIGSGLSSLLEGHPDLNEIIRFDRHGSWASWWRLLQNLRSRRFDLVFDLQGLFRTGVMTLSTRAASRVGLETAREGARLACTHTIADTGRQVPAHLRYWRVAEAIGVGGVQRVTRIVVPDEDEKWAGRQLSKLRGPILAIHPGARWITKRWPISKFATVAARAIRNYGLSIVILGSSDERPAAAELEQCIQRLNSKSSVLNLTGQTTIKQLAAVLKSVDVVLSNDSGPMHLAAGLGIPVVGIFTCTSAVRSGPAGRGHELVSTKTPCAASYKKRCPHHGAGHLACMDELDSRRVWAAIERVIELRPGLSRVA